MMNFCMWHLDCIRHSILLLVWGWLWPVPSDCWNLEDRRESMKPYLNHAKFSYVRFSHEATKSISVRIKRQMWRTEYYLDANVEHLTVGAFLPSSYFSWSGMLQLFLSFITSPLIWLSVTSPTWLASVCGISIWLISEGQPSIRFVSGPQSSSWYSEI